MNNNQIVNEANSVKNMANQLASVEKRNQQMLQQLAQAEQQAANQLNQITNLTNQMEQKEQASNSNINYTSGGYTNGSLNNLTNTIGQNNSSITNALSNFDPEGPLKKNKLNSNLTNNNYNSFK